MPGRHILLGMNCVATGPDCVFRCAVSAAHFFILYVYLFMYLGVITMSVKFTSVKCPECGANLPIESGRERLFCSYCGTQIIMTNENEHTYRHVDEAALKRAETEQLIHLRELELEEKENERSRKGYNIAFSIAGVLALIGALSLIVVPYNLLGIFAILIAVWIALFTFISIDEKKKKKLRRIASPYEVQITENMCSSVGKNYNSVEAQFRFAGFSNIHTVPLCDLNFFTSKKNHQVESVSINGHDDFDEGEIFQKSDRVIITYHSQK